MTSCLKVFQAVIALTVATIPTQLRAENCNWTTPDNINVFLNDSEFSGLFMFGELNGATAKAYYSPRAESNQLFWMNRDAAIEILPQNTRRIKLTFSAAYKTGGGAWGVLSDARIKKNVRDFSAGLADIEQLRPRTFKYAGRTAMTPADGREYIGLIAQEARPVLPFLVSEDRTEKLDGTPVLTVDPSALTYVLINAVKETAQMAEDTESQLDALYETVCLDKRNARACMARR